MYSDKSIWWTAYALPKLAQVFSVKHEVGGRHYCFATKTFGIVTVCPMENWVEYKKETTLAWCFDIVSWFAENIFSRYKTSWRDMRDLKTRFEQEVQRCVPLMEIRINVRDGWILVSNESSFGRYSAINNISDEWLTKFCTAYRLTWTRDNSLGIFISSYYVMCDA